MKSTVSMSLEEDLLDAVDARAEACGMARSGYVELILLRHLSDSGSQAKIKSLARQLATVAVPVSSRPVRRLPIPRLRLEVP